MMNIEQRDRQTDARNLWQLRILAEQYLEQLRDQMTSNEDIQIEVIL